MHFTWNGDLIFLRSNLYPFWNLAKIICENQMKLVFCPIARQAMFSGGYVSLLTFSFILNTLTTIQLKFHLFFFFGRLPVFCYGYRSCSFIVCLLSPLEIWSISLLQLRKILTCTFLFKKLHHLLAVSLDIMNLTTLNLFFDSTI